MPSVVFYYPGFSNCVSFCTGLVEFVLISMPGKVEADVCTPDADVCFWNESQIVQEIIGLILASQLHHLYSRSWCQ